jgi:uncharacterized protein
MTNPYTAPAQPMSPSDEKLFATLTHVGGIFFQFWVPLIAYFVLKDRGPFIRQHTTAALNFHLTMLIAYAVGTVLTFVFIGFFVLLAVGIIVIIFGVMAAVASNNGQHYTYPLSITFLH